MPLRITFFIPGNLPIGFGMLFAPPTIGWTVLFQWLN